MIAQLSFNFVQRFILSPREEAVLIGIVNGKTQDQIAYELGLSTKTVRRYTESLKSKLRADSMAQATARAVQRGLVRCEDCEE